MKPVHTIVKICRRCAVEFTISHSGQYYCTPECQKVAFAKISRDWKRKNKEKINAKRRLKREENNAYRRKYVAENREMANKWTAQRRAKKKWATFIGADDEWYKFFMSEIYALSKFRSDETGVLHEVDHIIPLEHHLVCGLHTPDNLRVITTKENRMKHNKFDRAIV